MTSLPPALILLLAAPLVGALRGRGRAAVGVIAPLLALAFSWYVIDADPDRVFTFLGQAIQPVKVHAASTIFATIFCLMAAGGALFLANRDRPVELAGAMVYAGGALGVCFCGDWLTLFGFWEVMTLGSTAIIFSARSDRSYGAGMRYFVLHAIGGVVLLAGIVWLLQVPGSSALIDQPMGFLAEAVNTGGPRSGAAWLILVGMLINAGAPPVSAWIGDAYPAASETGTVFLSAFTTKTAVFTLMLAFAGADVLIYLGMYMACYGIIYALLENDIRRILAYSIVNQVGFMVCGIGVGTQLAIDGVTAHAFAHILYKALLLMSVGAVIQATGKQTCTEVGGLYRSMPVTMWCFIVGLLAMSSFPITSGYATKGMITGATVEQAGILAEQGLAHGHLVAAWYVLEAASVCVLLHAGIKVLWFVFFGRDSGLRPPDAPRNMKLAMILFAGLCLALGFYPKPLYDLLPYPDAAFALGKHSYEFYYIFKTLGLVVVSGLAFVLLLPLLGRSRTITLDTDWFYRRLVPLIWRALLLPLLRQLGRVHALVIGRLPGAVAARVRDVGDFGSQRQSKEWRVGATVVLVTLMLCFYLMLQYLAR